jgi:hypothetical protein
VWDVKRMVGHGKNKNVKKEGKRIDIVDVPLKLS